MSFLWKNRSVPESFRYKHPGYQNEWKTTKRSKEAMHLSENMHCFIHEEYLLNAGRPRSSTPGPFFVFISSQVNLLCPHWKHEASLHLNLPFRFDWFFLSLLPFLRMFICVSGPRSYELIVSAWGNLSEQTFAEVRLESILRVMCFSGVPDRIYSVCGGALTMTRNESGGKLRKTRFPTRRPLRL